MGDYGTGHFIEINSSHLKPLMIHSIIKYNRLLQKQGIN